MCPISCLEGVHLGTSRGRNWGFQHATHRYPSIPLCSNREHGAGRFSDQRSPILSRKQTSGLLGQGGDCHLGEGTGGSNCFLNSLSTSFCFGFHLTIITHSTCCCQPLSPRSALGKGFLFVFSTCCLIISLSWNCLSHLPLLHLLSGFQNIVAVVFSPVPFVLVCLYPLHIPLLML